MVLLKTEGTTLGVTLQMVVKFILPACHSRTTQTDSVNGKPERNLEAPMSGESVWFAERLSWVNMWSHEFRKMDRCCSCPTTMEWPPPATPPFCLKVSVYSWQIWTRTWELITPLFQVLRAANKVLYQSGCPDPVHLVFKPGFTFLYFSFDTVSVF